MTVTVNFKQTENREYHKVKQIENPSFIPCIGDAIHNEYDPAGRYIVVSRDYFSQGSHEHAVIEAYSMTFEQREKYFPVSLFHTLK